MKTVEELENKINDVEETLTGLKNELEELKNSKNAFEPTPKGWMPKEGEIYHFADIALRENFYHFTNDEYDNTIIKYNRIFKTEEECQLYCDIQRAFRNASREFKKAKPNHFVYFSHEAEKIIFDCVYKVQEREFYFDSEETIQNLIDKFGEENVKRYYLGVY